MEKDLAHSGSSERRRLDRMNALVRNASYTSAAGDEEDGNFRVDGGDDVTNILEKIGITRLDMLGISENEWASGMSRPSSGELRFSGHPELENPPSTARISLPSKLSLRQLRSFEPSPLNKSFEPSKPRRFSLEKNEESSRDIGSREPLAAPPPPPPPPPEQQTSLKQPQPFTFSISSQESSSGSYDRDRGDQAAESSFANEESSSPVSTDDEGDEETDRFEEKGLTLDPAALASTVVEYEESPKQSPSPTLTTKLSWSSWLKLDLLGSGSFGSVYRAVGSDGNFFAVKEVSLSNANDQSGIQLQQEIALLSHLQHENIVQYLGTQKENDKLYIFLELVTQGSIVTQYKRFSLFEEQIRNYTKQILRGLNYLHERKVVHRDIKCANILVHAHGTVKLADFGMAKQLEKMDSMRSCKGSVYWMAPEVINPRKTASFPADIWSLGCTVLEMATGKPPFSEWEWNTVFFRVGRGALPQIPESIQGDARDFLSECLQPDPSKRPTAAKLLEHPFVNPLPTGLIAEVREVVSTYDQWGVPTRTDSIRSARSVRTRQSIFHKTVSD